MRKNQAQRVLQIDPDNRIARGLLMKIDNYWRCLQRHTQLSSP